MKQRELAITKANADKFIKLNGDVKRAMDAVDTYASAILDGHALEGKFSVVRVLPADATNPHRLVVEEQKQTQRGMVNNNPESKGA